MKYNRLKIITSLVIIFAINLVVIAKSQDPSLRDIKNTLIENNKEIKNLVDDHKEIKILVKKLENNKNKHSNYLENWVTISSCSIIFLIICLIPLLIWIIIRTKEKTISLTPIEDKITELNAPLQQIINNVNDIKEKTSNISSTVEAKLEKRFNDLKNKLEENKVKVDFTPIITKLEDIERVLIIENKSLKDNENKVNEEKNNIEIAKRDLEYRLKNCERREQNITQKEEDIRRIEQIKAQELINKERDNFQEERKKLQNEINTLRTSLSKLNDDNASLKIQMSQSEQQGYQKGFASKDNEVKELSFQLGKLEEKCKNLEKEKEQIKEQEQQRYAALFQQQLSDAQNKIKEQYSAEINNLKSALTNKENILIQKDNCIHQLSQQKSQLESEKQSINSQLERLNLIVEQKDHSIIDATEKLNNVNNLLMQQKQANQTLQENNNALTVSCNEQAARIDNLTNKIAETKTQVEKLEKVIFPEVFTRDSDFTQLKEHLNQWLINQFPGADVVKSSLSLFAQRESLNAESWQLALRNISQGISTVMKSQNTSPQTIIEELVQWSKFLMKYSDENYDFSLKIPNIGDSVDISWMSAIDKKAIKVSSVVTWAVWHNQYGVRHNAEVE